MNVRELMEKLSRLDPNLPVILDVEDPELVGSYVEVMNVEFSDHDVCFDVEGFSFDGIRPYTRPDWGLRDTEGKPCERVALLSCKLPWKPVLDVELAPAAVAVEGTPE